MLFLSRRCSLMAQARLSSSKDEFLATYKKEKEGVPKVIKMTRGTPFRKLAPKFLLEKVTMQRLDSDIRF